MSINRFLNTPEEKPFHSSEYARVAHGSNIGSSSIQSFAHRSHLERNRTSIRKYRDSIIAGGPDVAARPITPLTSRDPIRVAPRTGSSLNAPVRRSFTEPPTRPYNPFG